MERPNISDNFTISDIHKIREYNYEVTKDMTFEERQKYHDERFEAAMDHMEEARTKRNAIARIPRFRKWHDSSC